MKNLRSICALCFCLATQPLFGQTEPGEETLHPAEYQPHHAEPPATPPPNESEPYDWPTLLNDTVIANGCNHHLDELWKIVIDTQAPESTWSQWIDRFMDTGPSDFGGKQHPSTCFSSQVHPLDARSTFVTPFDRGWWLGQPLNLDPVMGPEPGTLPPLSNAVASSSSPLLPAGPDGDYVPMVSTPSRETVGGVLDLVTGSPLLQATDFVLPFGGAEFRYTRTYADSPSVSQHEHVARTVVAGDPGMLSYPFYQMPAGRLWDWHGIGWMVSHNPILLFDAALPGLGGGVIKDDNDDDYFPRRTYFVPDAHHSIPFDPVVDASGLPIVDAEGRIQYEAPAHFGAHIEIVGGDWEPTLNDGLGGWFEYPHAFHVWTNNGAIKYTIVPLYEDVRSWPDILVGDPGVVEIPAGTSHDHAPLNYGALATGQRLGLPYLGLTVQIEDRYGNRIVNEFCGARQYDCSVSSDGTAVPLQDPQGSGSQPGAWPVVGSADPASDPVERTCCQSCSRKGQLRRTLLIEAGSSTPTWTLVYSHRSFASFDVSLPAVHESTGEITHRLRRYPYGQQSAIQTVRVYKGDRDPTTCFDVDFRAFHPENTMPDFAGALTIPTQFPPIPSGTDSAPDPQHWNDDLYDWSPSNPASGYDGDRHFDAVHDRLLLSAAVQHPDLEFSALGAGADWIHESRYIYSDASDLFRQNVEVFPGSYVLQVYDNVIEKRYAVTPRLLAQVTTSRLEQPDGVSEPPQREHASAYRYANVYGYQTLGSTALDNARISAVYSRDTIDSVYAAVVEADDPDWPWTSVSEVALALAIDDYDRQLPISKPLSYSLQTTAGVGASLQTVRESATHYFGYWVTDDDDNASQLSENLIYSGPTLSSYQFNTILLPGVRRAAGVLSPGFTERSYGNLAFENVRAENPGSASGDILATEIDSTTNLYMQEMVEQLGLSSPRTDLVLIRSDAAVVSSGATGSTPRTHKVYRFLHMPPSVPAKWTRPLILGAPWADWGTQLCRFFDENEIDPAACYGAEPCTADKTPHRSLYHHPHRFTWRPELEITNPDVPHLGTADWMSTPVWYTVIDEYPSQQAALLPAVHDQFDDTSGFVGLGRLEDPATSDTFHLRPETRRIVALNAMGYKVWERVFEITPQGMGLGSSSGRRTVHVHDDQGRVARIKSLGWSAVEGTPEEATQGLVTVYDYDYSALGDPKFDDCREPRRIGVRWGDDDDDLTSLDDVQWLREYARDPERHDVILAEVAFDHETAHTGAYVFTGAPDPTLHIGLEDAVFHDVEFVSGSSTAGFDKKIDTKLSVRSATASHPGGEPLYAIEGESFDAEGRRELRIWGMAEDLSSLGTGPSGQDQIFAEWFLYDDQGRTSIHVQDADATGSYSNALTGANGVVSLPTGWALVRPKHPDGTDIRATRQTDYQYGDYGLQRVRFPDATERYIDYIRQGQDLTIVDSVGEVTIPGGTGTVPTFVPGYTNVTRTRYAAGSPVLIEQLAAPGGATSIDPESVGALDVISSVTPEYDASGRPTDMTAEADGESIKLESTFNHFGLVSRSKTIHGTIDRRVHDSLGRLERVYRGTNDWSAQFGAPPTTPPGSDDLALVETHRYGDGVRNATLRTDTYRYWEQPDNPNKYSDTLATLEPHGVPTRIGHDWRMRDVLRAQFDQDGTTLAGIRVEYLDALDRVRFSAVFDPAAVGGSIDPIAMLDGAGIPGDFVPAVGSTVPPTPVTSASQLLASSHIRRLTETRYNERGDVEEVREYDLSSTGATPHEDYLLSRSYYDYAGRTVWQDAPSMGELVVVRDAYGREAYRSIYAGSIEVMRTATEYDTRDNPIIVTVHDRIDGQSGTLDETNAVITKTYNWYHGGKLACSAELGTGHPTSDVYASFTGADDPANWPAYNAAQPPIDTTDSKFVVDSLAMPAFADALVTAYVYDAQGNLEYTRHSDATVTRRRHDGFGNVDLIQRGITVSDAGVMSAPASAEYYGYQTARLVEVGSVDPTHQASTDPAYSQPVTAADCIQITTFEYDAEVVRPLGDSGPLQAMSANKQWISAIRFPGDETGDPSFLFQYYVDGSLASRTDARDVRFEHYYDDQGRRERTIAKYPDPTGGGAFDGSDVIPADRVHRVVYEYDAATSELLSATAYEDDAETTVVSQNVFTYDENGRLLEEHQQRGDLVDAQTPFIKYDWALEHFDEGNHARLSRMTYPERWDDGTLNESLTLGFEYGASSGDVEDILDRVTRINDETHAPATQLASFDFTGSGMRVRRSTFNTLGTETAIEGHLGADGATDGYEHFDRFGRLLDLHWRDAATTPNTHFRSQHTLDKMGNRIGLEVTRLGTSGTPSVNADSWAYGFDDLQRLIQADLGTLSYPVGDDPEVAVPDVAHDWVLDELGNWKGDATDAGLTIVEGGITTERTHEVGPFSEILSATIDSAPAIPHVYDASGNLVFDGSYWYRYDAWQRLIQIVKSDPADPFQFDSAGVMTGTTSGSQSFAHGDVVAIFAYDALGRLVGRQAPFPGTTDEWRTETYYYDGARRIAERWRDPIVNQFGGGSNGNQQNNAPTHRVWTQREYVYTPGYVDEFIAEYDDSGVHWPILQDANHNAIALLGDTGSVARQRILSPYGRVIGEDVFDTMSPLTRIGHQGLFAERLDADTRQDPMASGSTLAWHNRNRTLLSDIGRFAQRDPNASGSDVLGIPTFFYGNRPYLRDLIPRPLHHFGDGLNTYAYLRSGPVLWIDPYGLAVAIPAGGVPVGPLATVAAGGLVAILAMAIIDAHADAIMYQITATQRFITGDYDSAEAYYTLAEDRIAVATGVMAISHGKARDHIDNLRPEILNHFNKVRNDIGTGGPSDPKDPNNYKHHIAELRGFLRNVSRWVKDMKGKTGDQYKNELKQWIDEFVDLGGKWPPPGLPG